MGKIIDVIKADGTIDDLNQKLKNKNVDADDIVGIVTLGTSPTLFVFYKKEENHE